MHAQTRLNPYESTNNNPKVTQWHIHIAQGQNTTQHHMQALLNFPLHESNPNPRDYTIKVNNAIGEEYEQQRMNINDKIIIIGVRVPKCKCFMKLGLSIFSLNV